MRKSVIDPSATRPEQRSDEEWLNLEQVAKVEVTSEDPSFAIDSALASEKRARLASCRQGEADYTYHLR